MSNITKELIETLIQHPNIEKVYFDINGGHHFNVFPASAVDRKTGKKVNAPGLIAGGNNGSIVETLTRKQILEAKKPKEEKVV